MLDTDKGLYYFNHYQTRDDNTSGYFRTIFDEELREKEIKRLKDIADRFRYKPSKAAMAMSKLRKIEQMQIIDKPQNYDIKTFNTDLKINEIYGGIIYNWFPYISYE